MKRLFSIPLLNPPPLRRKSERGRKLPDPIPPLSPPFPEGRGEKIGVSSSFLFPEERGKGEDIGKRNFPSSPLNLPLRQESEGEKLSDPIPLLNPPPSLWEGGGNEGNSPPTRGKREKFFIFSLQVLRSIFVHPEPQRVRDKYGQKWSGDKLPAREIHLAFSTNQ